MVWEKAFRRILMLTLISGIGLSSALATEPKVGAAEMVRDLEFIGSVFSNQYAPRDWKFKHLGWDMEKAFTQAKAKAAAGMTVLEYRKMLKNLFRSAGDYHVGVSFFATESASLPFDVRSTVTAEGKRVYILVRIDRTQLAETSFPFNIGDELISIAGQPVDELVEDLIKDNSVGTALTDQMRAETLITVRRASSAMAVPKGPVLVEFKTKGTNLIKARQLIWNYKPEQIQMPLIESLSSIGDSRKFASLDLKAEAGDASAFAADRMDSPDNPFAVGNKVSFVPELGVKIWEAPEDGSFTAYVFRAPNGKLIGFVRINAYDGDAAKAAAFGEIITYFNKTTDGMIIDQVNNPGGYVFYMYGLASMLTDRPLILPRHKMSLDQSDVFEAIETLAVLGQVKDDATAKALTSSAMRGYSVDYQSAKIFADYSQFLIDEWNKGKTLSAPYFLIVDRINPHPSVNYDKPILLLTNALDYSCADFFPAIMQDNKRVTILGTRTAGAGGYVKTFSHPNQFGTASFRFTASLAERMDSNPIENLGVTPDIQLEVTEKDLREGFTDYKEAVLKTIQEIVK